MQKTIKIGFPSGLSGVYAGLAKSQLDGVIMAADEWNKKGGVLGRKIEIITKDDKSDPVLTRALTKELIYKDKVDLIVGVLSAATQVEANKETKKAKSLFMSIGMSDELTTAAHLGPHTFHYAPTVYMNDQVIAKWIFNNLGKKWYLIAADYVWGWNHIEGYKTFAQQNGVKIVGIKKIPFPAKDENAFTKHFPEIISKKPEVLIVNNAGVDQQKFVKEAHKAGLKSKMSIIHTVAMLSAVSALEPEEAVGMYWGTAFYWGLKDTLPIAKKFVTAYQKKFNAFPCAYAGHGYSGAMEALIAIEKIGKYPLDTNAITKELEGRSFAHYKHPEWWRPCDHQALQDWYILKFKGPEERKHKYDSSEIVGQTSWDLDCVKSCQSQGQGKKLWGHIK